MVKVRLINERGNDITVSATPGPAADEVTFSLVGPASETTNCITLLELEALRLVLDQVTPK